MRGTFLALAMLGCVPAYAVDWASLKVGTKVELAESLTANVLNSGVTLICRLATHHVYPKVKISPVASQGQSTVYAKYFTVVDKRSDAITYQISLQSDQMPCACIVHIMQAPEFWRGEGRDFARLVQPNEKAMAKEKPVPGACVHNPPWLKPRQAVDFDKIFSI